MPEVKTPATVIQVAYVCDECHKGTLKSSGLVRPDDKLRAHHCSACRKCFWLKEQYPRDEVVPLVPVIHQYVDQRIPEGNHC